MFSEQLFRFLWNVSEELYLSSQICRYNYIVFEEAQFFKGLTKVIYSLLKTANRHILIVGLDGDANQKPFGEIFQCVPYATSVTKLSAMCLKCKDGTPAHYTVRKEASDSQVDVGGTDKYLAVCLKHL
jgi:thymidine kinase